MHYKLFDIYIIYMYSIPDLTTSNCLITYDFVSCSFSLIKYSVVRARLLACWVIQYNHLAPKHCKRK